MASILFQGQTYHSRPGENLLDMFLRQGVSVPFSCKAGVCHTCIHQSLNGAPPAASQKRFRAIQKKQNLLLLCQCIPDRDLSIAPLKDSDVFFRFAISDLRPGDAGHCHLVLDAMSNMPSPKGEKACLYLPEPDRFLDATIVEFEEAAQQLTLRLPCDAVDTFRHCLVIQQELEACFPDTETALSTAGTDWAKRPFPDPDPSLWTALDNGRVLMDVLKAFYPKLYADPVIAPFFENVTINRIIEKQYNFLYQAITGEKVFFGERPRNSHHWMVITDDIFDHREAILKATLDEFDVDADTQRKLLAIERAYKDDIVKEKPWPKILFGKPVDTERFEALTMDAADLCDGCGAEVDAGEQVLYHTRTGKVYCSRCRQN